MRPLRNRPQASRSRKMRGWHGRESAYPAANATQAPLRGDTSALEDGLPGISQMAQASHLGKRVFADSLYSAQPHSNADVSPFGSARPLQAPLKAAGSRKTAPETRKAPPRVYRDGAFCKEARVAKRFRGTEGSSTRNCEPRQGKQRSRSTECARPG